MGGIEPPTWEEFRAYISRLPEGKGGWGFLRYEMLKGAEEVRLREWYDLIIVPVVEGKWTPGRAVKEAELMLLHKKLDRKSLDHYRGIGLLQHAYKIMEWALMAGVWKKLMSVIEEEIQGFMANRGVCQALWRVRAENDRRRELGEDWAWLAMDVSKAFDTVAREVGLAAAEGLGVGKG